MFTGIISDIGVIEKATPGGSLTIAVRCRYGNLAPGESVAANGACLTVVKAEGGMFAAELSGETLDCTAKGQWEQGRSVNLERALTMSDLISGHLVTGHVDGVANIVSITPEGDSRVFELEAPASLARYIAAKGSVTLDGVSLTVNRVESARFWVNIIPHTLSHTTLGQRQPGEAVNLEIDLIARYVERLLAK
jgi:riboflavin synthase